jgi:carboxypeptidase family protein
MRRPSVGAYVLFGLLTATQVWSQSAATSLRGTIADPTAAFVANAQVRIENKAIELHQATTSDEKGQYQFQQITPGTYTISVSAPGFATQSKTAELLVAQPATINFVLSIKSSQSTVEVTDIAQTVNTTDATIGNAVNNATIQALPMEGRNVPDLLSLQPGVLYLGRQINENLDSRSGAVAGARSDQGNVTLDGVDNNDQVNGFAFTGVLRSTLDSVEEFRVTTTSANADAGRSSGAQVSMLTKSGTNQLHGSVYEYNRNTAAVANNWFNKKAELSQGLPNVPGELIRNVFGVAVGGPIRKNKLFYFVNYEGQRTAENTQQTLTVPTASLRAGSIKYLDASGDVVTLTPSQIAGMDPHCLANGTCPWGPGVNPNSLAQFNQYPLPNGFSTGDGLNTGSFTWSAPDPASQNTYIAKVDYQLSERHHLFTRGNLQNDRASGVPQFPGQPPSSSTTSNTKGVVAGVTSSIKDNLLNNFRYGFIRQESAGRGIGQGAYVNLPALTSVDAETRSNVVTVPVQNLIDDVSWIKHHHTVQVGLNYRLIRNQSQSDANSYSSSRGNSFALNLGGIANTGQSLDPGAFGFPAVAAGFGNSYDTSTMALTGLINLVANQYNYQVSPGGTNGALLDQGAFVNRDFKNNEFEYYVQDSWRVTPNLTVTFGLRHTLLQTPYEVNGQQVQPNIDIDQWFETRGQQALLGNSVQPLFAFAPSGQSRGGKPYWPMQRSNVAPRFAIAYSPRADRGVLRRLFGGPGKSSIRAGFGMYYDHFGEGIVSSFNKTGSFGLSTTVVNEQIFTPDDSPRFTGIHDLPQLNPPPATSIPYPFTPSANDLTTGYASTNGLDDHIKTPYSFATNLSVQRELRGGFIFEAAYVGRFGRHLLQQRDLGAPLDLVDPRSGVDYYAAATQLSKLGYSGANTVAPIPYWEDMFPDAAGGGNSATQNVYNLWRTLLGNETLSLYYLDILCTPGCNGQPNRYWSPQWSSLYAWSSIGTSNYNAGQFMLRHAMTHGLQMDLSYTYSKSMDLGSDAERTCAYCANNFAGLLIGTFSQVINSWNPRLNYGLSDFDTTHIVTGDWVYQLPFGTGKRIGGNASRLANAAFGDWQISGLSRWTSGLPFGVFSGNNFSTNYNFQSWLVQTGSIKAAKSYLVDGSPDAFADPVAIASGFANNNPLRNAFPGEAGQRNRFRGDGYFGIDAALAKSWKISEQGAIKFSWEVFNITNSVRFDTSPLSSLQNNILSGQFGVYGATLTASRVQQFSLRFSF